MRLCRDGRCLRSFRICCSNRLEVWKIIFKDVAVKPAVYEPIPSSACEKTKFPILLTLESWKSPFFLYSTLLYFSKFHFFSNSNLDQLALVILNNFPFNIHSQWENKTSLLFYEFFYSIGYQKKTAIHWHFRVELIGEVHLVAGTKYSVDSQTATDERFFEFFCKPISLRKQ